jgi:L-cystine transport system permease protein
LLEQRLSLYKRGRTFAKKTVMEPEYYEDVRKERYHAGIEEYS